MDYQKIYDSIIQKAKSLNRKKGGDVYYELHHIIPRCMGGGNEKENLVLLTAKEHYVCHKILFIIHTDNLKLSRAYHSMVYMKKNKIKIKLTSREYEEARKVISIASRRENLSKETLIRMSESNGGENNGFYNKRHTEATKLKNSIAHKRENLSEKALKNLSNRLGIKQSPETIAKKIAKNTGKKRTQETINKMSEAQKGEKSWNFGKKLSKESISKREETKRNRTQSQKNETSKRLSEALKGKNRGKKSPETIAKREETKRLIREERRMMIF